MNDLIFIGAGFAGCARQSGLAKTLRQEFSGWAVMRLAAVATC